MPLNFTADGVEIIAQATPHVPLNSLAREFDAAGIRVGARPFSPSATVLKLIEADGDLTRLATRLAGQTARPVRPAELQWALLVERDVASLSRFDIPGSALI